MFKKSNRLVSREEIVSLLRSKNKTHCSLFSIYYNPSDEVKAQVLVPKKIFKRAIDRNRVRRRITAILAPLHTSGSILVKINHKSVLNTNNIDLRNVIEELYNRLTKHNNQQINI